MLDDCYQGRCDQIVIVSGDSDFIPAIETIRLRFPNITTSVYVPTLGVEFARLSAQLQGRKPSGSTYAQELRAACHKNNDLPIVAFLRSQLPNPVTISEDQELRMPATWSIAYARCFETMLEEMRIEVSQIRR